MRTIDGLSNAKLTQQATFATTSALSAKVVPPKKSVVAKAGKPGNKAMKTLTLAKRTPPAPTGRPVAPGERKAVRKRIVLSNTNALGVKGLERLDRR